MRGQNTIVRLRLENYRPSLVWLLVLETPCPTRQFLDAERVLEHGGRPEVHIGADESVGSLDLRSLTGLTVLLHGMDRDRVRAVFARLKQFNPARVIVSGADFFHDTQDQP